MNQCCRLGWAWLLWSAVLLATSGLPGANARPVETIPVAHLIPGVPWHVQINGLACGDGALESVFKGIQVENVNTVRTLGKIKKQNRTQGRTPEIKKAYVTLKEDSKPIEFFEGMAE